MFHRRFVQLMFLAIAVAPLAFAQSEPSAVPPGGDFAEAPDGKIPANVIIIKGAEPSASDRSTPLPEDGRVSHNLYQNRYLGLAYPLPSDWAESFEGPPPSDTGEYVLAQLVPGPSFKGAAKGIVLITAQDMFFARGRGRDALEMVSFSRDHLPSYYRLEREPVEVQIADRSFVRYDYMSESVGLHWFVLATGIRCHTVQFVFMGQDTKMLESLVAGMAQMTLPAGAGVKGGKGGSGTPVCVANYASTAEYKVDPDFPAHHFNAIPVRFIVDKKGAVRHVHVISGFADQAAKITDALMQWKFKPYEVNGEPTEVESGIVFGGKSAGSGSNVD